MVVDALVAALKDHDGYTQYLANSVPIVAERIETEYATNVQ